MDAVEQMNLFGTLFYVSMGVAILGFLLAVILFFLFDIRNVYAMMTGKAQKRSEAQMREKNKTAGSIRMSAKEANVGVVPSFETTGDLRQRTGKVKSENGFQELEAVSHSAESETTVLHPEEAETAVLQQPAPQKTTFYETSVLKPKTEAAQEDELSSVDFGATTLLSKNKRPLPIRFEIIEAVTEVHSNERI